jgi:hypothetical protein
VRIVGGAMKRITHLRSRSVRCLVLLGFSLAVVTVTLAQTNNECDLPGEAPDVIIENIYDTHRWGVVDDITAFSLGTYACNIGTCWAVWFPNINQHPVISGNMYRLMDGKLEQIGQSWLKHGFFALSGDLCSPNCIPTDGSHLGVNCADPYSASLNGEQDRLGPKFEVNPSTGEFPYPATDLFLTGNAIYKRIQVHNDDLNPLLNPGAVYFMEAQYVTPDEPPAGTHYNNTSHRPVNVTGSEPTYNLSLTGQTEVGSPAILAWANSDPDVQMAVIDVPDDGRYYVAAKATDLGAGMWHYEYAIENQNSYRAVGKFKVPILPSGALQNIGFHDVDYHSGEPFDGADWRTSLDSSAGPTVLVWQTDDYVTNPDANALRWDTTYNFRFDADTPPRSGSVTLSLFLPGTPDEVYASTVIPQLCNYNGTCDPGEDVCACVGDCVPNLSEMVCDDSVDDDCDGDVDCWDDDCCSGIDCDTFDPDGDGVPVCEDCNEHSGDAWATPGEVRNVRWQSILGGQIGLAWTAPEFPGGVNLSYQVLRSETASDFVSDVTCLTNGVPSLLWYVETAVPDPGITFNYLIRGTNKCPGDLGQGDVGSDSAGVPRPAVICP